jgi:hypothetical protein
MPISDTIPRARGSAFAKPNQAHSDSTETARGPEETLRSIVDGLAETVLEVSDEEIFEETTEEGFDPLNVAKEIRQTLLDATKALKQGKDDRQKTSTTHLSGSSAGA